jgi:hypothetical protein
MKGVDAASSEGPDWSPRDVVIEVDLPRCPNTLSIHLSAADRRLVGGQCVELRILADTTDDGRLLGEVFQKWAVAERAVDCRYELPLSI